MHVWFRAWLSYHVIAESHRVLVSFHLSVCYKHLNFCFCFLCSSHLHIDTCLWGCCRRGCMESCPSLEVCLCQSSISSGRLHSRIWNLCRLANFVPMTWNGNSMSVWDVRLWRYRDTALSALKSYSSLVLVMVCQSVDFCLTLLIPSYDASKRSTT